MLKKASIAPRAFETHFLVAGLASREYYFSMTQTLEERMEKLERKVEELVAEKSKNEKDWRRTFGLSGTDEGFDEMAHLGWEYREQLKHP